MSYPGASTPNPSVHQLPGNRRNKLAFTAQELEAIGQKFLAGFLQEVIRCLIGLVPGGQNLAVLRGILTSWAQGVESGIATAAQPLIDAIANALGHPGTGHTPADILTYIEEFPAEVITGALSPTAITVGGTEIGEVATDAANAILRLANLLSSAGQASESALGALLQAIVSGWQSVLNELQLASPTALVQQIQGAVPALVRDSEGGLHAVGTGLTRDAEGAITFVEDGLTHIAQQADQGLLGLPQIGEQIVHAATTIAPTPGGGVADVMHAGQTAHTALTSAIEQAGATVENDIVAGATQLGAVVDTAKTNASGVIDAIVQAARNDGSLVNQAVSDAKAELDYWWGGITAAFTGGNTSSPPAASAADAVVAAGAIHEHLSLIGNGGEQSVDIDLSGFSNGSLPATWTASNSGGGSFDINSGKLRYQGSSGSGSLIFYTDAAFLTDYQQVSAVFNSLATGANAVAARANPTTQDGVWLEWSGSSLRLMGGVDASTVLCTFTATFTAGHRYTLICGDPATNDPRKFQALDNGTPLTVAAVSSGSGAGTTTWNDSGNVTNVGGANRAPGMFCAGTGPATFSDFSFQDTMASEPADFVSTAEPTSSSTYGKLTTTSDQIAVNIGASGKVWLFLGVNSSSANSLTSFSASGANTIAASDGNAILGSGTRIIALSRLNPGITLFDMEYRSSGGSVTLSNRSISGLAL